MSSTHWTCATRSAVDTFVIVSGDSDFSPLVSKLRENNKIVIGVGVKHPLRTSDGNATSSSSTTISCGKGEEAEPQEKSTWWTQQHAANQASRSRRKQEAIDLVMETIEALSPSALRRKKIGVRW